MKKLLMIGLLLTGIGAPLQASPSHINFQGTLKQKGVPVNGTRNMRFRFLVTNNGSEIPGTVPIDKPNVQITQGLFAVPLPLDPAVDWQAYSPYIEVSVEGQKMGPDQPINANLYSMVSIPLWTRPLPRPRSLPTTASSPQA